jgi:hypothetical protein
MNSGPIFAWLPFNRNLLQFYKGGVITSSECWDEKSGRIWYPSVVTGYNKKGINGSKPFYTLRGSLGTFWGEQGLFRIQKRNNTGYETGDCENIEYTYSF